MEAELVNQIVRQVVEALRGYGKAPAQGSRPAPAAAAQNAAPDGPRSMPAEEPKPVAKVFVTAEMLTQRLAGGGAAITLAHNEHLTPAAADLAEEKHVAIQRESRSLAAPPAGEAPANPGAPQLAVAPAPAAGPPAPTIGLISGGDESKVNGVVTALGYDAMSLVDYDQRDCWMQNLRALCGAITGGQVSAGVALLPYAADAMLLAGKIRGIRPIQGTRPESVSAAVRRFDANLLVLEHAFRTFHEMRTMVRRFATERTGRPVAKALLKMVDEAERI